MRNMSGLFYGQAGFNADISRWSVSTDTDVDRMFDGALQFDPGFAGWMGWVPEPSFVPDSCWQLKEALLYSGESSLSIPPSPMQFPFLRKWPVSTFRLGPLARPTFLRVSPRGAQWIQGAERLRLPCHSQN
jgi:hypothetical protein